MRGTENQQFWEVTISNNVCERGKCGESANPKRTFGGFKMAKVTQTMRFEIAFDKTLYELLDDITYAIWRVKNRATTIAYDWQQFSFSYNERYGEYPKEKNVIGVNLESDANRNTKDLAAFVASRISQDAAKKAVEKFKDMRTDILRGNKSIPNYRRDGSFPMRATGITHLVRVNSKTYTVKLSLLSKEGAKERETTTQQQVTLKTGNGANVILDRIIAGEYKLCDSEIVKRKSKYYLMIAYQFEAVSIVRDKSKIMGVDLGVVNAATLAFNDEKTRYFIEGSEIRAFRSRVEARRNQLLRQGKYCGDGRTGHGRKTHLKPIEKLRDKVANFRDTANHRYARFIVDKAVKHGCGVIQIEDLTGITKDADRFLKSWTYDDLQKKIEQKAKVAGIEVRKVNPYKTSQRCSRCGYIDGSSRKTQSDFTCVNCGYHTNADYNAARNIAIEGIDKIIAEQMALQSKVAAK